LWLPAIVPNTEPLIAQAPPALLVYDNVVAKGALEPHAIDKFDTVAKLATGAGSTVITRLAVMFRLQLSVNVQLSV
jgi:predicted O-methyltransferase YrrM